MERWEDRSKEYIHSFIGLFEKSGVLNLLQRSQSPFMFSGSQGGKSDTDDEDAGTPKTVYQDNKSKQQDTRTHESR